MSRHAALLVTTLMLGLGAGPPAYADEAPRYNQIRFAVERSRPVDNDRMRAVLSTTAEDDSAARLADQVNRTMDWALKTAKARPRVEVRTGAYQTTPVYDKNRIRRWRASQELLLEGGDFAELGTLIGQLQERLQVTAIQFSVSPARRAAVEDELIAQAIDAFKQRAELVRRQFAAKGYRVVNVAVDTGSVRPVPMLRAAGAADHAFAESVAPPAVQAGTSTITINVNGAVELQ